LRPTHISSIEVYPRPSAYSMIQLEDLGQYLLHQTTGPNVWSVSTVFPPYLHHCKIGCESTTL
jgi:hypothetical protein